MRPALLFLLPLLAPTLAASTPLLPLRIALLPSQPRQGDTLSVDIHSASGQPPQLSLNGKAYTAFHLAGDRWRSLVPTTPLDRTGPQTLWVTNGGDRRSLSFNLKSRSFPIQHIWLSNSKGRDLGTDYEFNRIDAFKALRSPEQYWQGAFRRPSAGPVSSVYGVKRYYNGKFANDYYHRGIDYAAPTGTPVVSPAAGRVVLVGYERQGFELHGNTVGIDHGQGVLSIMIHLHRIDVQEGQTVGAGQRLGTVGTTGSSTGPHLHWGLYVQGEAVDPLPWRGGSSS
jgi:murein DD-endopeptidase MepM/ murein hydrolase activator NlpD